MWFMGGHKSAKVLDTKDILSSNVGLNRERHCGLSYVDRLAFLLE